MAGLMNNYFYGKAGKGDYTVDQMPTTRKQLFFTTLRVRLSSMVGLNLLHVVFLLPMIIWLFINYQTLTMYATDEAYKLGGAEMKAAYEAYIEKYDLYSAIQNEAQNTAELKYNLEDVEDKIAQIEAGKTIMVKEAPVVEGGEETERPATVEELTKQKEELEAKIAKQQEYRDYAADEAFMDTLKSEYQEAAKTYNSYRRSALLSNISMLLLVMIPMMGLAGIGSTGQMYILRNWARDEHAFMWQDYKASIKANWKQGLVVGLLNGLSLFLAYIAYVFYGDMASSRGMFFVIPQMLMIVLLIVWWMINEIIFPMMVTYDMKLSQLIRNSAIMVVARLPISFVILLGSLVVPVLLVFFVPYPQISMMILVLLYGLIGFSLTGFVYASYANDLFDRYLNPRIEGAEVGKGLHRPDDDEDDEEENKPAETAETEKPENFWEHKSR